VKDDLRSESVEVSSEAIAALAAQAANEVEGATVFQQKSPGSLTSRVKREFVQKGIKVIRENGSCRLEVHLKVDYGTNIPGLAVEVKRKVKEYVEGLTEIAVEDIEIIIEDIEPPD
jgi:uncharacterized alkaline shock family protein YloU